MCGVEGADAYVNAGGGRKLYAAEAFAKQGIGLCSSNNSLMSMAIGVWMSTHSSPHRRSAERRCEREIIMLQPYERSWAL